MSVDVGPGHLAQTFSKKVTQTTTYPKREESNYANKPYKGRQWKQGFFRGVEC